MSPLLAPLLTPLLALAIAAPDTFTATASARIGSTSVQTAVTVTITRQSSNDEREAVAKAIRSGGTLALHTVLTGFADAGTIQVGERRTAIKFASERPTDSGRLVTIVTADPIFYLGGGLPESKPRAGYEVAVAMLVLQEGGGGTGELVPAARVGLDKDGSLLIQDYGEAVMWLNAINAAK